MATPRPAVYDALARLCEYPGADTIAVARTLAAALAARSTQSQPSGSDPSLVGVSVGVSVGDPPSGIAHAHAVADADGSGKVDRTTTLALDFVAFVEGLEPYALEELYVRTFDLHAAVCLDVGYQLFGETYKRGAFLVTMKAAARLHGLDGTIELPDHLSVALRLLARLDDDEEPGDLVRDALVPALAKMRLGFGKERGGYALLLALCDAVLRADFAEELRTAPAGEALPFRLPVVSDESHFEGINDRD